MRVMVAAVLTMAVAQLLDLATFALMMQRVGVAAEANPIVAGLFGAYGMPVVAVVKVALLALVTAIVAVLAAAPTQRARASIIAAILTVAIAAGLVGGASNMVAIGLLG